MTADTLFAAPNRCRTADATISQTASRSTLVQIWYQTVKFKRPMSCEHCKKLLAPRASTSAVLDERGEPDGGA